MVEQKLGQEAEMISEFEQEKAEMDKRNKGEFWTSSGFGCLESNRDSISGGCGHK
jgi:hypothetical protein